MAFEIENANNSAILIGYLDSGLIDETSGTVQNQSLIYLERLNLLLKQDNSFILNKDRTALYWQNCQNNLDKILIT